MSKKEVYATVAAILTALLDAGDLPSPETSVYLAMGMDLERYHLIRDLMVNARYITVSNNTLQLTEDGRKAATELNALLAKA